jgi:hypothetical protein
VKNLNEFKNTHRLHLHFRILVGESNPRSNAYKAGAFSSKLTRLGFNLSKGFKRFKEKGFNFSNRRFIGTRCSEHPKALNPVWRLLLSCKHFTLNMPHTIIWSGGNATISIIQSNQKNVSGMSIHIKITLG